MREKLLKLMKSEKLTSSRLAEILEIQPSSISHILSGRNKPSYDFLVKILRRFPTLNPDWLLLDAEQMYRPDEDQGVKLDRPRVTMPEAATSTSSTIAGSPAAATQATSTTLENSTNRPTEISGNIFSQTKPEVAIERVIVLYSDKSFEAYNLK